jgi:hypothetical protein
MKTFERISGTIRIIVLVGLLALLTGTAMCSAQSKELAHTRFSNHVALETGSVIGRIQYDSNHDINITFMLPHIWDIAIDMHNLTAMAQNNVRIEMVIPWTFHKGTKVGDNYTAFFKYHDQIFAVMLVIDTQIIIVSDLNQEMKYNLRQNL